MRQKSIVIILLCLLSAQLNANLALSLEKNTEADHCATLFSPVTTQKRHKYDESVRVRHIYDGDTLLLSDGRKVRLTGINTPELKRKSRPAEAFSGQAKRALESLFKHDKTLHLIYGKDKKDRYGRTLAHAFLANGQSIQKALLLKGLANAIQIPPNTQFAHCYLAIENRARCNKAGLWKNKKVIHASQLNNRHIGFQLVEGKVTNITSNTKGLWLNMEDQLTIGIRPDNQHLFNIEAAKSMVNKMIIVRGWVNKSNRSTPFYLRAKHPLSIQLSSDLACP